MRKLSVDNIYLFRVTAHNEVGASKPSEASVEVLIKRLAVNEAPSVQGALHDITCTLEQTILLSCIFGGVPLPTVEWYKDGKSIKTNVSYENRIASLTIHSTSVESIGAYSCKATNALGSVETKCSLSIEEKPKIIIEERLISQTVNVGSQWSIFANIKGYPKPSVKWMKNNSLIKTTKEMEITYEEHSSTISIASSKRSHSAKYTIAAENFVGRDELEISLRVLGKNFALSVYYIYIKCINRLSVKGPRVRV